MDDPEYLGDGVYVKKDFGGIQLRNNDYNNPTDIIYIEPEVMENLIKYYKKHFKLDTK